MLKEDRINQIYMMLKTNGKVEVSTLCRLFQVTEMTIRRDLKMLHDNQMAIRTHGGAILPYDVTAEKPYEMRIGTNAAEKEAIAREAQQFIGEGESIFFDSSTTVYTLARMIDNNRKFLAVTDTLRTATELNTRTDIRVICLGGELQKSTGACSGIFTEKNLETMYFDTAFLGLSRVSLDGKITTSSANELAIKKKVMSRTKKVIFVIDSSKIGQPELLEIGTIHMAHAIVTDDKVDKAFTAMCKDNGLEFRIAQSV